MTDILLVLSTFPDLEKARQIGTKLVESQLAACVNLCPGLTSIYRWKGAVETGAEVLAIFKTTSTTYPAMEQRLRELHPYEVPEIVAIPAGHASAAYAQWVAAEVLSPA
ncbi:divalent-cation tolerance protein CutA [Prosthecobacter algae]|uniref:divalent-cation tolerance protein CutA n=1 Tax=Prosthecobacter algae TaxID=1144682 RepID=UPI0031F1B1FB